MTSMQPSSILLAISNVETLSKFRHRLFVSAAVFLLLIFSRITLYILTSLIVVFY